MLQQYIPEARLVSVREIHPKLQVLKNDWQLILALKQLGEWDGLVTLDEAMLSLPKEVSVLLQTRLALVVAAGCGSDAIQATGLLLAHLPNLCRRVKAGTAQIWRLRVGHPPATDPWEVLATIATKRKTTAQSLFEAERLSNDGLAQNPLE